jgi:energy-coupling factor transport system ATP-binding protein
MHMMAAQPVQAGDQTSLFALHHLAYSYPDGTPGLREISLNIFPGDRIALVGRNGSGKSTLIRHLNGLITARTGECRYQGQLMNEAIIPELRLRVGILFQDPDDHLFCPTLYEDVAFGPRNQGRSEAKVDRLVRDNLAAVGLDTLCGKPAHHLSYGQKKRAALAAILAMEPEVLILDEPTANLDPRQEAIFKRLLREYTGTLIVIEHDLLFLYDLCERAVVLVDGQVHHDYGFNDLVSHPQALRDHGLDFAFRFTCCGHHHGGAGLHRHHHPTHNHGPDGGHLAIEDTDQPLIELQHYSFCYPDGTPGVDDINLGLFAGETLALVGENGAGKSTLAHCLLGLHHGEGTLLVDGKSLTKRDWHQLWQRVGIVFQHSADQLFCPSCWEEVAFGPQQLGLAAGEVERRVRLALALVRLEGFEERVPLHMSGGERKRLAIAAALSLQPEVLILDEPTASLDPKSEEMLLEVLAALPMTKVLITHDLFFIRRLCKRTVVLHQGRIIRDYPTDDFLADDHLQAINGLDYTYKSSCYTAIQAMQQENCREE